MSKPRRARLSADSMASYPMARTATARETTAVAVIDAGGTVIGWSQAAEELLGYRAEDILHHSSSAFLRPTDRGDRISAWLRSIGDEEYWSTFAEACHRDGGEVLLHLQGSRLSNSDGTTSWLLSATSAAAGLSALEPLVSQSPVGMCFWDSELRCVWLNESAKRLQDFFSHHQLGSLLCPDRGDGLPGNSDDSLATAMQQIFFDGSPMIGRKVLRTSAGRSEKRTFSISAFRLEGLDGSPVGLCAYVTDITGSGVGRRLKLLIEAGARIGSTLDIEKTAQELADLAVPALADYVTVDLADSVLPDSEPLQRLDSTALSIPIVRRVGVASIHPGLPESLWRLGDAVFAPPASPFTKVLSSGRPHFESVLDASRGTWLDLDPTRLEIIHRTGMHTLMIVPLKARGEILGITVFVRTSNPSPFTADDLMLAEDLASRAALSLDNARRYTHERATALALQHRLLPRKLSGGNAVEVASRYLPADVRDGVGGDWFDTIPLAGGRIALVVGDVAGHGINAAATMGQLRTAVRTLAIMDLSPGELLARLDDMVVLNEQDSCGDGPSAEVLVTCLYAVYDPASQECTMATAGHPPPAVIDPSGDVFFADLPKGPPLGLGLGTYESLQLRLAAGTLIVLYTDGLIETREADIEAGMERLRTTLTRVAPPLEQLCTSVIDALVGRSSHEDDIALLVARTGPTRVSGPLHEAVGRKPTCLPEGKRSM